MARSTLQQTDVAEKFRTLALRWQSEIGPTSSITEMAIHPAYHQIIGRGPAVVPLLLRARQERPDHWFWAPKVITGEDPVRPAARGRLDQTAKAWLTWAKQGATSIAV